MTDLKWGSTGITELDDLLHGLRIGDNVVLQVDSFKDYIKLAQSYGKAALKEGKRVVYIRFGAHEPVFSKESSVKLYCLNPDMGFEPFASMVRNIVDSEGEGVYYIFDCLSDLLVNWSTDLMVGNFFVVTCPYLFKKNTIAYFSLLRNSHSHHTIARIRDTTQVLLDIYNRERTTCIHPLKVWNRYSPTMFLPHVYSGNKLMPLTNSGDAANLLSYSSFEGIGEESRKLDHWERVFLKASRLKDQDSTDEYFNKILRMIIGHDERVLSLFRKYFTLSDLLNIKTRLVGSGMIGGKAVGVLLARAILQHDSAEFWRDIIEPHDSFYIGSDVFYTYLVENNCWDLRQQQKVEGNYFSLSEDLRKMILNGHFPEEVRNQFVQILEYFGQSPIIVRSSSLLEDSFGNAFAGKYESYFLVNQGSLEKRYAEFEKVIRLIYASTMNKDALVYRKERGLADSDEQMALLVQRVSGTYRKGCFLPDAAGVGLSKNLYIWKNELDRSAGMLRLVVGLGTRAVNRIDDDYARVVALDRPTLIPDKDKAYSQHSVDLLSMEDNAFKTVSLNYVFSEGLISRPEYFAKNDYAATLRLRELGSDDEVWELNFMKLFTQTTFPKTMSRLLKTLEAHYKYSVDVEFTLNMKSNGGFQINLVQCRPLQVKGSDSKVEIPEEPNNVIFKTTDNFMGYNMSQPIETIVYVDPKRYGELSLSKQSEVARLIGKLNSKAFQGPTILIGPGRWGTSTSSLGVPVSFAEISNVSVLVEIGSWDAHYNPDFSYGTHFFQDLVETGIFYVALLPGGIFNRNLIKSWDNLLESYLPDGKKWKEVIFLYNTGKKVHMASDIEKMVAICFCK